MANDDEDEYAAALEQHGFRNRNHWKRVQATFLSHYAKDPEFTNAAMVARQEGTRDAMKQAVKPGMLDPIEGVSLQVYASIAVQQMSVQGAAFVKLLGGIIFAIVASSTKIDVLPAISGLICGSAALLPVG